MPWRLIGLALIFVVFLVFTGFNLGDDNRCDISFVFWTAKNVPVFLPIFTSFVLGLLCAIPFAVSIGRKRSKRTKAGPVIDTPPGPKKKRGKGAPGSAGALEELPPGGPYDIG